jgi:hypothetical protein
MRKLRIQHLTRYDYAQAVQTSLHSAHLMPRHDPLQNNMRCQWTITPEPIENHEHRDYFGNHTLIFRVDRPHTSLIVDLNIWVERARPHQLQSTVSWNDAREIFHVYPHRLPPDCWPHLPHSFCTPFLEGLQSYTQESFILGASFFQCCSNLMSRIFKDFKFDGTFSKVDTPIAEVFKHRKGVCQDFAHIMISGLRSLGIPARYVSGYIETLPTPGKEKLVGVDASHAWVAIFFPGFGWVDFDPTNNLIPGEQHISVACGRDYLDVSPVRGIFHGLSEHTLTVNVDVSEVAAGAG